MAYNGTNSGILIECIQILDLPLEFENPPIWRVRF